MEPLFSLDVRTMQLQQETAVLLAEVDLLDKLIDKLWRTNQEDIEEMISLFISLRRSTRK